MRVLIVEACPDRSTLWGRHLERQGVIVRCAASESEAIEVLDSKPVDVIVLNLELPGESPLAVASYAEFRQPDARVIFVTGTSFFSDGSLFSLSPNACACTGPQTPPEDMAALVEYHGRNTR